jgi:hypothetical protein
MKQKTDPLIQKLMNKQVNFQFHGMKLKFDLSMGLFSSFDIDAGTKLLLKTLAKKVPLSDCKNALDTGCGTGVLGICLKKKYPDLDMQFQDRDALAIAFSSHNAHLNGLKVDPSKFSEGLLLDGIDFDSQDLIVCNIPAKAGEHVIRDFITKAASCIRERGTVAVVIVDTLKDLLAESIKECGCPLLYTEATRMHSVFHFGSSPAKGKIDFSRYIRKTASFKICDDRYKLSTVYNLPDFDQVSFWLHVSGEILHHTSFTGRSLFWNPGQGHLPVWLHSRMTNNIKSVSLASRDILQNKISFYNLKQAGFDGLIETYELPDESSLCEKFDDSSFDCIFLNLNPIPKVKWHKDLAMTASRLVKQGRFCFIMGRSSDMSLLEKHIKGFKTVMDERFKGNRGLLLKKN